MALPLHAAAAAGDLAKLGVAIAAADDLELQAGPFGRTALHEAVANRRAAAASALLKAGAECNSENLPEHRWRPIHEAAVHAGTEMIALLLLHGADPTAKTAAGETALQLAEQAGKQTAVAALRPLFSESAVDAGLALVLAAGVQPEYIADGHYSTGSGTLCSGGETAKYSRGIVINTRSRREDWSIVAYHGTPWVNANGILKDGLLPGNPTECKTFSGDVYGAGVYCSPRQSYAKLYHRGEPRPVGTHGRVRLVFGLRIRSAAAITKTTDDDIWVIRNPADVVVQDINLTFEE